MFSVQLFAILAMFFGQKAFKIIIYNATILSKSGCLDNILKPYQRYNVKNVGFPSTPLNTSWNLIRKSLPILSADSTSKTFLKSQYQVLTKEVEKMTSQEFATGCILKKGENSRGRVSYNGATPSSSIYVVYFSEMYGLHILGAHMNSY